MKSTNLLFPRKKYGPDVRLRNLEDTHVVVDIISRSRPNSHPLPALPTNASDRRLSTRTLQVSYHRDHVYLFDATGARRNSSAISDPALSSYFMPALPPPLPPPPTTPECSSNTGSGVGGRGDAGDEGGVARGRGFEESADGILEAHRALSAWDGRGGACKFAF